MDIVKSRRNGPQMSTCYDDDDDDDDDVVCSLVKQRHLRVSRRYSSVVRQ